MRVFLQSYFLQLLFVLFFCGFFPAQIGVAQENRRGAVSSLAVSHDGKWIVANDQGRVFVSDARTGRVVRSLSSRGASVSQIAVSPDGKSVAAVGADVEVRDAASGQLQFLFSKPEEDFRAVRFSPDNRILAAAGAAKFKDVDQGHKFNYSRIGEVRFWELRSGKLLRAFRGEASEKRERFHVISALAWSQDGSTLAVGGILVDPKKPLYPVISEESIAALELWDARSGVLQSALECPLADIHDLNFSADGNTLAGGDKAGNVRFWNASTGAILPQEVKSVLPSEPVALLPDGNFFMGAKDGALRLHDAQTTNVIWSAPRFGKARNGIAFNSDDRLLAAAGGDLVYFWDTQNWQAAPPVKVGKDVSGLALSGADGKMVLATFHGREVEIWDVATAKRESELPLLAEAVSSLAFSPDGSTLLVSGAKQLALWDVAQKRWRWNLTNGAENQAASGEAVFSLDGKWIASAQGNGIEWRDAANGKLVRRLRWPQNQSEESEESESEKNESARPIASIAISSDGALVAAVGARRVDDQNVAGEIRFWNAQNGELMGVAAASHHNARIRFLPGERQLVIGSDFLECFQVIGGEKSVVLTPLWKTGGAYRGHERD